MKITKSTFIKNYKDKVSNTVSQNVDEAIHYAFELTDTYGIMRINKAILEASIMKKSQVDIPLTVVMPPAPKESVI